MLKEAEVQDLREKSFVSMWATTHFFCLFVKAYAVQTLFLFFPFPLISHLIFFFFHCPITEFPSVKDTKKTFAYDTNNKI